MVMPINFLNKLPKIRALCLRQCGIRNFNNENEDVLLKLPELRNLNLEENMLTEFSCINFVLFPSLQILNLNGNMITQIRKQFAKVHKYSQYYSNTVLPN